MDITKSFGTCRFQGGQSAESIPVRITLSVKGNFFQKNLKGWDMEVFSSNFYKNKIL